MEIIKNLLKKLLFLLQITLIVTYITFEELVWERFAKPIFRYIKYLKVFEKLEQLLSKTNKYVVLLVFIVSLIIGEGLGVLTPIIALKGYPILAVVVYSLKLLIAAFAFWVFNTQKKLLLSFKFVAYLYEKLMLLIDWIKSTYVYNYTKELIHRVKIYIKVKYRNIKNYILNRFWR